MTAAATRAGGAGDGRRRSRSAVATAALLVALAVAAVAAGWDVSAWLHGVWASVTSIPPAYVAAALALQTLQLLLSAIAMTSILRYAYPAAGVTRLHVTACVATAAAVNAFVPASLGTVVMILMLVATIEGATPAGIVAATAVEKIFWLVAGVAVNVYGLASVGASFRDKLAVVLDHPWLTALVAVVAVAALAVAATLFWHRLQRLWHDARQGGGILREPRAYLRGVVVPQALAWCCKGAVVAVLLAAFAIPVGVRNVVTVVAGNALGNVASVTPGGIGVNQAFAVASLHGSAEATRAGTYSITQQLLTTAWSVVLAAVLVAAAFGPDGGRRLLEQSYREAKAQGDAP